MSLEYIRKYYGVPAKRGGRVEYSGEGRSETGTICGARGAHLSIRLDGVKHTMPFHPTWKLRYLDDRMPAIEFKRAPCVKCGARTELQAETQCRPVQGIDGDYHCPGEFNDSGRSIAPTEASIARLDAWCDRDAQQSELERTKP